MADPQRKVLIIGDSISMYYTPVVQRELSGQFEVTRIEGNGRDSRNVLEQLDAYLAACPGAEIIHFNCGLHDLRLSRKTRLHQVLLTDYRANLQQIIERLAAEQAKLIWARTTPVIDERRAARAAEIQGVDEDAVIFDRHERDVVAYNSVADKVMADAGVAINDLHAAVIAAGLKTCVSDDGVHMTDDGYAALGAAVAKTIREIAEM